MSVPLVHHTGEFNAQSVIVIVCSTLGLYNALELLLLIFTTFKHYGGLYFWSLLVASFGIVPYTLGWLIVYFSLTHNYVGFIIDSCGWVMMVTGQSVVLYSRLHLVLRNETILRAVKWMIIVDALVFHVTTTVVLFGSNLSDERTTFTNAYGVIEKLQMTAFCIQEFIISGLYVWETVRMLRVVSKQGTKRVMWQLFIVNVIIIAMDIALLALEYRDLRVLEQAFKVVIYSIKLKLEFAILGKLVELVQQNGRADSMATLDVHTFVDDSKRQTSYDGTTMVDNRRSGGFASRPSWLEDIEKMEARHGTVQHVEETSQSQRTELRRPSSSQRKMHESDLIYAEFSRSLSK